MEVTHQVFAMQQISDLDEPRTRQDTLSAQYIEYVVDRRAGGGQLPLCNATDHLKATRLKGEDLSKILWLRMLEEGKMLEIVVVILIDLRHTLRLQVSHPKSHYFVVLTG